MLRQIQTRTKEHDAWMLCIKWMKIDWHPCPCQKYYIIFVTQAENLEKYHMLKCITINK